MGSAERGSMSIRQCPSFASLPAWVGGAERTPNTRVGARKRICDISFGFDTSAVVITRAESGETGEMGLGTEV
jgi:hypothetical protein